MKRSFFFTISGILALSGVLLLSRWHAPSSVAPAWLANPPPTEHWLDQGVEKANKAARKEWFKRMHSAPPGVDWKTIEKENGLAQLERRNRLAQDPPSSSRSGWVEHGSNNQAGRTHVTRVSPDGAHLYVGSSLGGLWRGGLDGEAWEPLGDTLWGGVHWLEVLPSKKGDVLVAANDGGLIHRSVDDGATWQVPEGLGSPYGNRRLLKTRDDTLYLMNESRDGVALYRSRDLGASFQEILHAGSFQGDLWASRTGPEQLWALTHEGLLSSEDAGDTWSLRGPLPASAGRAELVGSEAGAPRLWCVLDRANLYRSDDAGLSWSPMGTLTDYWSELNTSPSDPNLFAYGGVELWVTFNGGESFAKHNAWSDYYGDIVNKLHADMMGVDLAFDAYGVEVWYINTDGGTYRSTDNLRSVTNISLNGLRVSQYYDTLTSTRDPANVAGGAQDQGYQLTNGLDQEDELYEFTQILSGDYGHLTSSDGTHDYVYSVYPGFVLVQIGESRTRLGWADFPPSETYVPWLPPIVADPKDKEAFFFPAQRLYRYTRSGDNWYPEPWSEQSFEVRSGEYATALAFSPIDPNLAWMATSNGSFFLSTDQGVHWTLSEDSVPDENWYYGQAILPSKLDPKLIYVGGSGYGSDAVFRSEDGGLTWQDWGEGLPSTLVYCLCEAPDGSGVVFAGTENSAWRRAPDGIWEDITTSGAPITIYWSCESLHWEDTIRFGTYGRGIWDYTIVPPGSGCYPALDQDDDGSSCDLDCDDTDPDRFPGNEERCDGQDANCDPEDLNEIDADGDGHLACAECDDGDPTVAPGLAELCGDGIDQDCDGLDPDCEEEPLKNQPETCGCASGGSSGRALWLVLLALVFSRRRVGATSAGS